MYKKESYVVSAAIVVAVVTMFFFPVTGTAADLQKLDQIPPTWSKTLSAADRFELVLNGAAVLDKETGLVWEKSPGTTTGEDVLAPLQTWGNAIAYCDIKNVGGRLGWHLPTIEQLASLVDQSMSAPSLPSGHPFTGVQSSLYWSASTNANGTTFALLVYFVNGNVVSNAKTNNGYVWCVRGGQTYDGQ